MGTCVSSLFKIVKSLSQWSFFTMIHMSIDYNIHSYLISWAGPRRLVLLVDNMYSKKWMVCERKRMPKLKERKEKEMETSAKKRTRWPHNSSDEVFPFALDGCVLQVNVISKGTVQVVWVFLLLHLIGTVWLLLLIEEVHHDSKDTKSDKCYNCYDTSNECWVTLDCICEWFMLICLSKGNWWRINSSHSSHIRVYHGVTAGLCQSPLNSHRRNAGMAEGCLQWCDMVILDWREASNKTQCICFSNFWIQPKSFLVYFSLETHNLKFWKISQSR